MNLVGATAGIAGCTLLCRCGVKRCPRQHRRIVHRRNIDFHGAGADIKSTPLVLDGKGKGGQRCPIEFGIRGKAQAATGNVRQGDQIIDTDILAATAISGATVVAIKPQHTVPRQGINTYRREGIAFIPWLAIAEICLDKSVGGIFIRDHRIVAAQGRIILFVDGYRPCQRY